MKAKTVKTALITAAAFLVAAAVLLISALSPKYCLVLKNARSGEEFAAFPVEIGQRFSVEFVHSVNLSPVRDIYEIRDNGAIYVVETHYYAFGAGVQTQLNPGEVLEYGEDGSMQIKNINTLIPDLIYVVGTVFDHVLSIDGAETSLRSLCGKNSSVSIAVERRNC